jgi:hypothetical protein
MYFDVFWCSVLHSSVVLLRKTWKNFLRIQLDHLNNFSVHFLWNSTNFWFLSAQYVSFRSGEDCWTMLLAMLDQY